MCCCRQFKGHVCFRWGLIRLDDGKVHAFLRIHGRGRLNSGRADQQVVHSRLDRVHIRRLKDVVNQNPRRFSCQGGHQEACVGLFCDRGIGDISAYSGGRTRVSVIREFLPCDESACTDSGVLLIDTDDAPFTHQDVGRGIKLQQIK